MALPATLFADLTARPGIDREPALRQALGALWPGRAWNSECEQDSRDSGSSPGPVRLALADGSWLVQIACAQGAYQGSSWAAQVWPGPGATGEAALLCWPVASEREGRAPPGLEIVDEVVVWGDLASVGTAAGQPPTVEIVNRYRAIGDCGTRSRYTLQKGRVSLVELATAFNCPDTVTDPPSGPADWPRAGLPVR